MAGLALRELEMWTHRFIGIPAKLKNLKILGHGVIKSNARVYFMNLYFL